MPNYAYRWADGSISVCTAEDKSEAWEIFDEIAPVCEKLIIELDAPILLTFRPKSDKGWKFDTMNQHIGSDLDKELLEKCYPNLNKVINDYFLKLEENPELYLEEYKKKLRSAIRKDRENARKKIDRENSITDFDLTYPQVLPGQEN